MMAAMGVRVLFTGPSEEHTPGTPPVGLLNLEFLGSGKTALTTAAQPARLVFSSRFIEKGREAPGEFSEFAFLAGSILLSSSRAPVFTGEGAPKVTGAVPPPDSDVQQTDLLLKARGSSVVLPKGEGLVVPLPVPPTLAKFLEVGVELEVSGAVEAAKEVNDCLDVRAFRSIKIELVDNEGEPVPFEKFEVRGVRREKVSGELDDKGEARVQGLSGTHCQVVFPSRQQEDLDTEETETEASD